MDEFVYNCDVSVQTVTDRQTHRQTHRQKQSLNPASAYARGVNIQTRCRDPKIHNPSLQAGQDMSDVSLWHRIVNLAPRQG